MRKFPGISSFRIHDGKTLDTVTGLREWEVLGAECAACGKAAWLDKRKVLARVGNQYLLNLRGKLKCTCGNKAGNAVLIGQLDRNI
jgi:hypothetical protein